MYNAQYESDNFLDIISSPSPTYNKVYEKNQSNVSANKLGIPLIAIIQGKWLAHYSHVLFQLNRFPLHL